MQACQSPSVAGVGVAGAGSGVAEGLAMLGSAGVAGPFGFEAAGALVVPLIVRLVINTPVSAITRAPQIKARRAIKMVEGSCLLDGMVTTVVGVAAMGAI